MIKKKNNVLVMNIIFFVVVLLVVFIVGIFVIRKTTTLTAEAQEVSDEVPPEILNVNIKDILATSSVITWETNEMADSLINFGLDKDYGIVRDPRSDKMYHKIILEDLMPNMTYYFRITSSDSEGNQGISSDYSFVTPQEEIQEIPKEILLPEELEGDKIIEVVKSISTEETLEIIQKEVQQRAEEVVTPPTVILDVADVEVGTDYAVIPWGTDKISNSMVALAAESDYNPDLEDPYTWKVGEPNELVLEHIVRVDGLKPATVYHFQVSSQSELGLTGRSKDRTFKTKSILPEIYAIRLSKIEEESATIKWSTNVPCSSIIEYTNLNTNQTKLEGNSSFITIHTIQLTGLTFDTYYSFIIKVESEEGEKAESNPITFITTRDEYPPVIAKVNTESTIYPGSDNKIQTIASWETDEAAQCQLFYHQGLVLIDEPSFLPKKEDFATKHVNVITNFVPSAVYKFWIVCNDEAENEARSEDFTMLTPSQEESIIDIIIKNFESSFGWVKKIKVGG